MSDRRFTSGDVTETLIKATEFASEMGANHCVVILYKNIKDDTDCRIRLVTTEETTVDGANWMLDKAKFFLLIE